MHTDWSRLPTKCIYGPSFYSVGKHMEIDRCPNVIPKSVDNCVTVQITGKLTRSSV